MKRQSPRPSRRRIGTALGVLAAIALSSCTPLVERATLTRSGAQGSDHTGDAVDISGDGLTMVVGTPNATLRGTSEAGVVTLYTRAANDVAWTKTTEFGAKSPVEEGHFGTAVSLSNDGNTMVVGAPGYNLKGAAYVYSRTDGEWSDATSLGLVGSRGDNAGSAVSIANNGKVIAVGVPNQSVSKPGTNYARSGRVWIYEDVAGVWTLRSFVAASIPQDDMYFGRSVAVSGDGSDIVVGAPNFDMYSEAKKAVQADSGRVELLRRSGNAWAFSYHLVDVDTIRADYLVGSSVGFSSDGTTIAVGAPGYDSAATDIGAVIAYKKNNNGWDRVATVFTDQYAGAYSGRSVSVSSTGEYIAVGASGYLSNKGGVVVLKRTATGYEAANSYFDTGANAAGALVGQSIAISDDGRVIAAGAPGTSNFAGAVKVVDRFTKPDEPTAAKATAADGSALVSWTAPAENGGLAPTYTVTSNPDNKTCTTTGTSCVVTGLTNGTSYTFRVSAKNAAGTSQGSLPSAAVVPSATVSVATAIGTVSSAPTNVKVVPGWKRARISWRWPTNDGGQRVVSFTVTASPGGQTCMTFGAQACTITGLAARKQHSFSVIATNAVGNSAAATTEKYALQPKVSLRGGPSAAKLAGWQGIASGIGEVVSMQLRGKAAKANCKIVNGKLVAKVAKADCKVKVTSRYVKTLTRTITIHTVRR